jgi:thioredoxin reductase (NADPH)
VDCTAIYVMIGADPCTEAAEDLLATDDAGYLCAGVARPSALGPLCWPLSDREPHLLETIRPGVFAAGDVRAGAAKRVAGAGGAVAYDVLAG